MGILDTILNSVPLDPTMIGTKKSTEQAKNVAKGSIKAPKGQERVWGGYQDTKWVMYVVLGLGALIMVKAMDN